MRGDIFAPFGTSKHFVTARGFWRYVSLNTFQRDYPNRYDMDRTFPLFGIYRTKFRSTKNQSKNEDLMLYVQNKNITQYRIACLFYHWAINLVGKFEFNHSICRSACKQVPAVFVLAMVC